MDRQLAAPFHFSDGEISDVDPSNLRFLRDKSVIKAAHPAPRQITRAEDLTIADNVEAIKAASYVIRRAIYLIFVRLWRMTASWFAVERTQTRRRQWVSACAYASVGAAIQATVILTLFQPV